MTFDDDFDPARLAEDAVRANLDPRCFEQIDDRDILRPSNLFEWMRGSDFLAIKPFPKQVEIGTNMLGEFCPRCTDPLLQRRDDHFGNKLLEIPVDMSLAEIQEFVAFLSDGQCGHCGATRPQLLADGILHHYLNLNGVAGMRASKSVTVGGLLATYQLARFLMLPNPSRFFGLMDNQMLHGTFVAITAGQAYDTLWQAFKDRLDSSPWFRTYHEFLKSEGDRLGRELFDVKDTFVWYGHKQLSFSFCGPDIRTIRGRTRFFCVAGDTLLNTPKGLLRFDELGESRPEGFSDLVIDVCGEHGPVATSKFYRAPKGRVVRLTTKRGYELTGTLCHPIRTLDDRCVPRWKQLSTFLPNDPVILRRGDLFDGTLQRCPVVPVVGQYSRYTTPEWFDEDIAWLTGILVAEGTIRRRGRRGYVKFPTGDEQIRDRAIDVLRRRFGHTPPKIPYENNAWQIRVQSPRIAQFYLDLDIGHNAATKKVPLIVRQSPRRVIAAFLQGYFDGDGCGDATHISAHSLSMPLLRDIQVLLLGLGIVSHRSMYSRKFGPKQRPANTTRQYWVLKIFGDNLDRFHCDVAFGLQRKTVDIQHRPAKQPIRVDMSTVLAARVGRGRYRDPEGVVRKLDMFPYTTFAKRATMSALQSLDLNNLHVIDPELANNLAALRDERNVIDYVSTIEYIDDIVTYDLTVPDGHAFVASGFINHNTSIDELGWFDVQAESGGGARIRMNAVEAHEALIKSLRTVRSASRRLRSQGVVAPDGLNCDVSSPSSINDAIMRGLRDANSDPTIYAFHYATWEMNPDVPLDSLRDEMRNKLAFERDYGAVPPLGANQFIDAQNAVEKCCTDVPQRRFATWTREQHTDEYGESSVYLRVTPSVRDQTCPRILTVDTGLSNNSFAVSVWHYDRESRNPVCDIALECAPDKQKGAQIPVNFPLMFEHAIMPLVQNYRIIMAVYDRWNSIEMVQRLRQEHRVESYQYSLKWADFLTVRARILDSSLRLPHPEMGIEEVRRSTQPFDQLVRAIPVTHLVLQTLTVREVGRKVIKPLNGTDDLFRCLCLAVKFMLDPAHTKKFERYSSSLHEQHQAVGVVRSNRAPTHRSGVTVGARRSFTPRG